MNRLIKLLTVISLVISIITGVLSMFSEDKKQYAYLLFLVAAIIAVIYLFLDKSNFLFKLLEHDIRLDIIDDKGTLVKYKSVKKLKCIKENASEYVYRLSTAGSIENINIDNGVIKDVREEDGQTFITTELNKPMKKGEEVNHTLTCDFINSFTKDNELWTLKRNDVGSGKCTFTVLFPDTRKAKTFKAFKVKGQSTTESKIQPEIINLNNKYALKFEINNFKLLDVYKVKWTW